MGASIFISFASQDHRVAMTLCQALESRGFKCWISSRDILPGENFQIAIVRAIRNAKIMLLVFTANSNNSDEMNKELALASQNKLMVVPLRIEDVTPNDAFAYEFATRQWIDFFADWEMAVQQLAQRIEAATRETPSADAPSAAVAPEAILPTPEPAVATPALAPARKLKPPRPDTGKSAARTAPVAEARTFAKAETPDVTDPDDALETPSPRPRRMALYIGLSVAALIAVAVGVATPSLMRSKTASAEPRAMTALLPTAPPSAVQRASTAPPAAAAADVAVAADSTVAADADAAPVKAPPKKKKAKAANAADEVPY
jgi:TIR domain